MEENAENLVLIVRGAVINNSEFLNLEVFMNALRPQQRSHLVLGVGIKVKMYVHVHDWL